MAQRHRIPTTYIRDLTAHQYRALGGVISLCQQADGTVGVSARQLASVLGMAPSSYSRAAKHLAALVERGALEVVTPGTTGPNGVRKATVYRLAWVYLVSVPNPVENAGQSTSLSVPREHSQSVPRGHTQFPSGTSSTERRMPPAALGGRTDASGCFHPRICGCPECNEIRRTG